jgi:hypothetical protein
MHGGAGDEERQTQGGNGKFVESSVNTEDMTPDGRGERRKRVMLSFPQMEDGLQKLKYRRI